MKEFCRKVYDFRIYIDLMWDRYLARFPLKLFAYPNGSSMTNTFSKNYRCQSRRMDRSAGLIFTAVITTLRFLSFAMWWIICSLYMYNDLFAFSKIHW